MNNFEYIDACMRTASTKNVQANAISGFNGEVIEYFFSKNTTERIDELSDINWYVSLMLKSVFTEEDFITAVTLVEDALVTKYPMQPDVYKSVIDYLGVVNDMFKKIVCHEKNPYDMYKDSGRTYLERLCFSLGAIISKLLTHLNTLSGNNHFTIEDVRRFNIEKLKKRHPDGFDNSYQDISSVSTA